MCWDSLRTFIHIILTDTLFARLHENDAYHSSISMQFPTCVKQLASGPLRTADKTTKSQPQPSAKPLINVSLASNLHLKLLPYLWIISLCSPKTA
mgnify:CR=1 FL=1